MKDQIDSVKNNFFKWVDEALTQSTSTQVAAFHFNLYEGKRSVHVQLIGADEFVPGDNPETDYWPGDEVFSTGEKIFEIPFAVAGRNWEEWLQVSLRLIMDYMESGKMSEILRKSKGVGAGFVDGDMHLVYML